MKKMLPLLTLNHLLMFQMLYCFAGIMYNVGSIYALQNGLPAWGTTDPVAGIASVAMYGLFLSAGLLRNLILYKLLMFISIVLFGYGGIVVHLLNIGHIELYQSIWTWLLAIGINSFGLILNSLAIFGCYKAKSRSVS
jgi:hypothetical protein